MKYIILLFTTLIIFVGCSKNNDEITDPISPTEPEKVYIYSAVSSPTTSESVTIKNNSGTSQDLTGWIIGDINDPTAYKIPNGTNLIQGAKKTYYRSTLGFQINDTGEIIYLKNSSGNTVDTWSN